MLEFKIDFGNGETSYPLNLRGLGLMVYNLDKALNFSIYQIGASFKAVSQVLRKFLHTGYWRRYAMVIFSSIIILVLLGLLLN